MAQWLILASFSKLSVWGSILPPLSTLVTHTHTHYSPRSGALQPGDWILGINGVLTHNFMQAEVNTLLQNAGNVINLEIAFEAPPGKYYNSKRVFFLHNFLVKCTEVVHRDACTMSTGSNIYCQYYIVELSPPQLVHRLHVGFVSAVVEGNSSIQVHPTMITLLRRRPPLTCLERITRTTVMASPSAGVGRRIDQSQCPTSP